MRIPSHDVRPVTFGQSRSASIYWEPLRALRTGAKRLTIWAYSHGYISFDLTERVFGWLDLRDA